MNRIDKYIQEQKTILPNQYLENRILASIDDLKVEVVKNQFLTRWQIISFATAFVLVITLGISLGNSYRKAYTSNLLINDTYIEQLSIYKNYTNE